MGLSYGVSGTGYLSKYQSEKSDEGLGGSPLPLASLSLSHGGSYSILESLKAVYSLALTRIWYYELDPEQDSILFSISDLPDEIYRASFGISHTMDKGLSLSAGFSKGNLITQIGTLDLAFFDEELSQYYLSLGWSF